MSSSRVMSPSGARAAAFLAAQGASLEALSGLLRAIRPSDTLLAVGSVTSGLASRASDFDLLLIGSGSSPVGFVSSVSAAPAVTYRLLSGVNVKVRLYSGAVLEGAAATTSRLDEALYEPAALASLPHLGEDMVVLLHELRTGFVLANESIAQAWREELRVDHLHLYLTVVHAVRYFARRRGATSQIADGDAETAQWILRECFEELMAALLAALGETNPRRRWHVRLLRRHVDELGEADVNRMVSVVRDWHGEDGLPAYVADVLSFGDSIVDHIVERCPPLEGILRSLSTE